VGVAVEGVEVAVDELDRLENVTRSDALPDFAEAAGTEGADKAVAGDRFGVRFAQPVHGDDSLDSAEWRGRGRSRTWGDRTLWGRASARRLRERRTGRGRGRKFSLGLRKPRSRCGGCPIKL